MRKFKGSSLELSILEHCWAKNKLNNSAFFFKSVTYLLLWNKGGIQGFFLFNNVFNNDRKFLVLPLDPSIFLIYVCNIFLGYVQLNFSAVFENTLLYEISENFCHLKYNVYIYIVFLLNYLLDVVVEPRWISVIKSACSVGNKLWKKNLIVFLNKTTISLMFKFLKAFSQENCSIACWIWSALAQW